MKYLDFAIKYAPKTQFNPNGDVIEMYYEFNFVFRKDIGGFKKGDSFFDYNSPLDVAAKFLGLIDQSEKGCYKSTMATRGFDYLHPKVFEALDVFVIKKQIITQKICAHSVEHYQQKPEN